LVLNAGHNRIQDNHPVSYPVWQHKKTWALVAFLGRG
jgi:hypothetical protein